MKKSRYTETQIIKVLKDVEGGRLVKEVCREYGISDATYYIWKAKYGTLNEVREITETWMRQYNEERPMTHWMT